MAVICGDCCLLGVFRVDRGLMVRSYLVNLGEGGTSGNAVGVVLYVWSCIPVPDGPSVKCSISRTGPPTAVLRNEMVG